ncbi:hypothetical protein B4144_0734 [Bacillus atrophaeus]|nr:hypothetical protein B4144_0734 [Bacillus atrophaeus]
MKNNIKIHMLLKEIQPAASCGFLTMKRNHTFFSIPRLLNNL